MTYICTILLYVDHLKMYREIKCNVDYIKIQADIDDIVQWSIINDLFYNPEKCCNMYFSTTNNQCSQQFVMHNKTLNNVYQDLDLYFTSSLSFENKS